MDRRATARLTDQQRACLRFVSVGMTSKEIAPRLGIEPGSVDQHIKTAMRILGVADRRTAARMLALHERKGAQKLVYHSPPIVPAAEPSIIAASNGGRHRQGESRQMLREEQAPYQLISPTTPGPALPLPLWGAKPHQLNWARRLGWIVAAAIGTALAFGGLVSAIETLVRLRSG
jgi:DNA-binding CsgD family transcriptional regulator